MEELEKSKNVNKLIFMNVQNMFLIDPVLLKEYKFFIQNNESSLEK